MATVKITNLPAITGAVAASTDVIPIVDVSSDVTSKITRSELFQNIPSNVTLSAATTEDRSIDVGLGRTGDGNSFIDLITDATYPLYSARFLRTAGANGTTQINHRGTGPISIFAQEASAITFSSSNTERMRINTIGNVGIGETSPAVKLDVSGDALIQRLRSTTSTAAYLRFDGTGTSFPFIGLVNGIGTFGNTDASPIRFNTDSLERMRIDAEGDVGIGTTNPTAPLHVVRTGATDASFYLQNDTANASILFRSQDTGLNTIYFGDTTNFQSGFWQYAHTTDNLIGRAAGSVVFQSGGATERARIHASGGVSIGNTTDPGATNLSVTGGIKSTGAQGIGYDTGAGIAVTQLTSRTTATPTTGNKLSGAITLFTAAPTLSAWFSFTVPNTAIAATDVVIVSVRSGTNTYVANVTSIVAATSFTVSMASILGVASDTPIVNFNIIRGVAA
jgi:hypothetical protein